MRWAGVLGLALVLAGPRSALAAKAPPAADPEATATAILNQVVDGSWEHTDHFFHNGDYETTSRLSRLIVRMDPTFVEAINTLAWLLRQGMQRPMEALALHYRAVHDNPQSWEAHLDLGQFYFDHGAACLQRKDRILAGLERRPDKDAEDAVKQRATADAEAKRGAAFFELSLAPLRRVVELNAPQVRQHMLAHAYEKLGRRTDAIAAWRGIVERFPGDQPARRNLERLEKAE